MIICGKDCEDCAYCTAIDDDNPGRVKVYCSHTDKWRWWGQCIPCDDKKRKKNDGETEEICRGDNQPG